MKVGDTVQLRFGPFDATGRVIEVNDVGARIAVNDNAKLVGFDRPIEAPGGDRLTRRPKETFIGRAHFATTEVIASDDARGG